MLGYCVDTIENDISNKKSITKCSTPKTSKRFLELSDKIRIRCRFQCGENLKDIRKEFKISPRTLRQIPLQKENWLQLAQKGSSLALKSKLIVTYPAVYA